MKKIIRYREKYVGYIDGDTFYTKRNEKHVLRICNSINISQSVLYEIEEKGAEKVNFSITLNGEEYTYEESIENLKKCSTFDPGDDLQRVIPLSKIKDTDNKKKQNNLDEYI